MSVNNTFTFDCAEPWFSLIKEGKKTVEGRICSDKYKNIKQGSTIKLKKFGDNETYIYLEVLEVRKYSTFAEMIEKETLEKVLPIIETVENGVNVYRQFYKQELELEKGVLALEIKVIN